MFLFGKKKISIQPFMLGAFGKLPFYKDFLYASFGNEFSVIKTLFDNGMDHLQRAGFKKPFIDPARNFYVLMDDFQNDVIGCVWDSHDGLRSFPFVLAAPFPRKLRRLDFPSFWTVLSHFWGYLGEACRDLRGSQNPSEFYDLIKGSSHHLNSIPVPEWESGSCENATQAGMRLNDGLMAQIDLTAMTDEDIQLFLRSLYVKKNPAMIIWPRENWRESGQTLGILGTQGIDDFQINWFPQPKKSDQTEPALNEENRQIPETENSSSSPENDSNEDQIDGF